MHAACWLRLCSCVVLVLVLPFSVAQGPGTVHRESVEDFVAKLNPSQKDLFERASKAFDAGRYAESLDLHKQLLKDFSNDPILCKFASEDAVNVGDPAFAVISLKPIVASDPDDWQATAILVHACAETGDTACRDAEMAKMADLHKRGLTPNRLYEYPVENVKLDGGTLLIKISLVPWGQYKVYAIGKMTDAGGRLFMTISLESNDLDQIGFAKDHPAEATQGVRMFSLDAYRETGLNSQGERTQTHFTYNFLTGQPDYATIRQDFLDIAIGKSKPISSRTGLIVPGSAKATVSSVYATNPLIPPALYAVQGAPFTATVESVWEGSATVRAGRESTKVIRDAAGRQRIESPTPEEAVAAGMPSAIHIYDVLKERMIELDPERKTAVVRVMEHMGRPVTIDLSVNPAIPDHPSQGGEYLGMQQIAGQQTWGQHLVQIYHYPDGHVSTFVRDLWLSTVYKMPLMQLREDARLGKLTQKVIRFEPGEPDESLFEIPPGYKVSYR